MLKADDKVEIDILDRLPTPFGLVRSGVAPDHPETKDCIGAIDGTHIPCMVYNIDQTPYRNRHGFLSQNVLAACTFDLKFIYVLAGWEGSANDARVLKDAMSRPYGLPLPQNKFYLVDCGYPNRLQFLAPYRGQSYHLSEFGPTNNRQ
ncbi:uncharacterized protein LOC109828233 [Asparagus officinalis]|uniref:uncharacterized protein LOC109828233 n=1 Tax=Asparagus officinalis TaxID=4686 RepID=UPI00098E3CF7|nr:uncharacterized protein LOC109828233 [Asparagus officinalis]